MLADLQRVLFSERAILERLDELAREITEDYRSRDLLAVAVLNGSFLFMGDLLRRIPLPLAVDCLSVASYEGDRSRGVVAFNQRTMPDVRGRDVLILDDILDTGQTLHAVRERLQMGAPRSVRICVLLRKARARAAPVEADYTAFDIADEFVVGYGLDFLGKYRNLPCIGVLSEAVIAAGMNRLRPPNP